MLKRQLTGGTSALNSGFPASQGLLRRARGRLFPDWTIPLTYSLTATVLGLTLPRIESRFFPNLAASMSASAAIAIESSVASGMIGLTGMVFALAFVMVQFSAVAYSPRLVPWIARDPLMMHSIGVFTATFLYALAALAWVDRSGSSRVPFFSTWAVILLLLVSIGFFVGLVQRLRRLQVQSILVFAGERGRRVIDALYPPLDSPSTDPAPTEFEVLPVTQILVDTGRPRAIQALDIPDLLSAACESGGMIEVVSAVGDTVSEGMVLLRVRNAERQLDERRLRRAFILGDQRTFEQDPKYAIFLLVDIAIRALSPAVNDPATAVQALDHIEDLLLRLGRRRLEIGGFRDGTGNLRLVVPLPAWEDFLTLAVEEIRHYGASSKHVMRRMQALFSELTDAVPPERRAALRREQERLEGVIARSFSDADEMLLARVADRQGIGAPTKIGVPADSASSAHPAPGRAELSHQDTRAHDQHPKGK